MVGRIEYDQLGKNLLGRGHARVVYHRVWCGNVS